MPDGSGLGSAQADVESVAYRVAWTTDTCAGGGATVVAPATNAVATVSLRKARSIKTVVPESPCVPVLGRRPRTACVVISSLSTQSHRSGLSDDSVCSVGSGTGGSEMDTTHGDLLPRTGQRGPAGNID